MDNNGSGENVYAAEKIIRKRYKRVNLMMSITFGLYVDSKVSSEDFSNKKGDSIFADCPSYDIK